MKNSTRACTAMPSAPGHGISPVPRISVRHSGLLYLGLFPMIILLWAWFDSTVMHTNWYHRRTGGGSIGLIIANSTFRLEKISPLPGTKAGAAIPATPVYGGIFRFGASVRDEDGNPMPVFPPLGRIVPEAGYRAPRWHVDSVVIPLWFVLACYIPIWVAASWLHVRWKRKNLRSTFPSEVVPQDRGD